MSSKIRILVLDDLVEARECVAKLLMFESDMQVVGTAEDAAAGIDVALTLQPDVVLLDLNLPAMDGAAAVERLTSVAPLTRVITMSTSGPSVPAHQAVLAGASVHLIKPFGADELATTIPPRVRSR